MSTPLLILQWILVMVALGAFDMLWASAWWHRSFIGVLSIFIFSLFPIAYACYAGVRFKKQELKWLAITYAVCDVLAISLQRIRLGFWAWPVVGAEPMGFAPLHLTRYHGAGLALAYPRVDRPLTGPVLDGQPTEAGA